MRVMAVGRWLRALLAAVVLASPSLAPQAVANAGPVPQPLPIAGGDVLGPPRFPPFLV